VTDSSDSRPPKSSRRKSNREPATIDLKATVIDPGTPVGPAKEESKPEETIAAGPDYRAEEAVATPEATLDSAAGTDSIEPAASSEETTAQETLGQETLGPDTLGHETLGRETLGEQQPFGESVSQERSAHEASPQAAPVQRRTSPAALIGSGLLGGLVGAGLVYGLQTLQGPQGQDNARLAQLEQRVGALGQQGAPPADLGAVEGRIRELEATRSAVDQRLQALQGTAEQAAARADEALNRPVPAPSAPQNDAALTELSDRLSALEGRVQAAAQEAAGAAQNVTNAATATQALDRRLTDVDRRLADLEGRLGDQQQRAAERERRLTEQDQRLAALSQQVTQESQGAEAASQAGIRVILSERLSEALQNGRPYPEVLEGLRKAGTDQARLAPLEPFAQQGAPTAAALAQSFEPLGATILRDERSASGAWSDRLLGMMEQVVTVRRVNEPGSAGVSSLIARIEQALERGNVAEAVAAWEALPEPARRTSEEWGRQAKAVAEANQASQAIAANALAALNQTAQ
jgi:hypothetical protein